VTKAQFAQHAEDMLEIDTRSRDSLLATGTDGGLQNSGIYWQSLIEGRFLVNR
jgi:hypothetical protein